MRLGKVGRGIKRWLQLEYYTVYTNNYNVLLLLKSEMCCRSSQVHQVLCSHTKCNILNTLFLRLNAIFIVFTARGLRLIGVKKQKFVVIMNFIFGIAILHSFGECSFNIQFLKITISSTVLFLYENLVFPLFISSVDVCNRCFVFAFQHFPKMSSVCESMESR